MGFNILVVEDNEYKRKRIAEIISSENPESNISECYSFTSAWKKISKESYDLILLDMSLPTFDKTESEPGGVFRVFGGKELARKMIRRNVKSKFIFITQYKSFSDKINSCSFDALKEELLSAYNEQCYGFILYSNNQSEWREELVSAIRDLKS